MINKYVELMTRACVLFTLNSYSSDKLIINNKFLRRKINKYLFHMFFIKNKIKKITVNSTDSLIKILNLY